MTNTLNNRNQRMRGGFRDMQCMYAILMYDFNEPVNYKPDRRFVPEKRGTRSYRVGGYQVRGSNGRKNIKIKDMRHEQRS